MAEQDRHRLDRDRLRQKRHAERVAEPVGIAVLDAGELEQIAEHALPVAHGALDRAAAAPSLTVVIHGIGELHQQQVRFRGDDECRVRRDTFQIDHAGWSLSYDTPRRDLRRQRRREAFLAAADEPTFLILSGGPIGTGGGGFDLELEGERLDHHDGAAPLLRGYVLPPRPIAGYRRLVATATEGPSHATGGFALRGLAYGMRSEAGFVRGAGWHFSEADQQARLFRWITRRAEALLHVPSEGVRLRVEGAAPLEYVPGPMRLDVEIDGQRVERVVLHRARFEVDVRIEAAETPFRRAVLRVDRAFVPAEKQRTSDRRELALRIYAFEVVPSGAPVPTGQVALLQ